MVGSTQKSYFGSMYVMAVCFGQNLLESNMNFVYSIPHLLHIFFNCDSCFIYLIKDINMTTKIL